MEGIVIAEHCCGAGNLYGWLVPTQQQLLKVWFNLEMIIKPCAQQSMKSMWWIDLVRVYHNFHRVVDEVSVWIFSKMRGIRMG